jgi:hypothetical protein
MDKITHINETPGVDSLLAIEVDWPSGSVRVRGTGIWSVRQARAYVEDLRRIYECIQASGLPVSALIDMSEAVEQSAEVSAIVANVAKFPRDNDAIAVLVSSSLAKMQARSVLASPSRAFFISRNAAETWLHGKLIAAGGKAATPRDAAA